jgi:signal recognition particle receptor subunit beta
VSEYSPLTTEAQLTHLSSGVDSLEGVPDKTETTVALDFGRITFSSPALTIYLFGTPGQDRFMPLWDDLAAGALAAAVLVDTARFADCFRSVEFFQSRQIPFIVAVNRFAGAAYTYPLGEVRDALSLVAEVPVVECDARDRDSVKNVLVTLIEYRIKMHVRHR